MGCVHWKKQIRNFILYYEGAMEKRDMAYHQGTVWTFPLGAYYLAYLKVHAYSERAKQDVKEQLEVLECALKEGCIGQLPEIYDGEKPSVFQRLFCTGMECRRIAPCI